MNTAPKNPEPEVDYYGKQVQSVFRIGNVEKTREEIIEGHRYLHWKPEPQDDSLSVLAGWDLLRRENSYDLVHTIEIPAYSRNAASVLSGLSAWDTEKKEVLQFIADYQRNVREMTGRFDRSVSLDTVGISKFDRQMFIVPPHQVSETDDDDTEWMHQIITDIEEVVAVNPDERKDLIKNFLESLTNLGGNEDDNNS